MVLKLPFASLRFNKITHFNALDMTMARAPGSVHTTSKTNEHIIMSTFLLNTSGSKTLSDARLHSKIPVIDLLTLFSMELSSSSFSNDA